MSEKLLVVSKRKLVAVVLCAVVLSGLLGAWFYALAVPSSTMYGSSGVYPGAPSYTVWREDSTYYAKDEYGAIAYESANATDLMNTAIDDLTSGGKIKLKAGTYTLSGEYGFVIWELNDIEIVGEGASTILTQGASENLIHFILLQGSNSCRVSNLRINGAIATQSGGTSAICLGGGSYNCHIENVIIQDMYNYGVEIFDGAANDWVSNSFFSNCNNSAIQIIYTSTTVGRNTITGNHIYNIDSFGIGLVYADRNVISNNEINQVPTDTFNEGINLDSSSYNTVSSNIVATTGDVGIALHMTAGGFSAYNVVDSNVVTTSKYHGIHLIGTVQYNAISNNVVMNSNQDASGCVGIALEGVNCVYNIVSDNVCSDTQGVHTQDWGVKEINNAGDPDYNLIVGVHAIGNNVGGILVIGANTECHSCFNGTSWVT